MKTLADSLIERMTLFPKGTAKFSEQNEFWKTDLNAKWGKSKIKLEVISTRFDLKSPFKKSKISKASFMGLISRSDTYHFKGKSSEISEMLLSSNLARPLLNAKWPSFEITDKSLIYKSTLKGRDFDSLKAVIKLNSMLTEKIDIIIRDNVI